MIRYVKQYPLSLPASVMFGLMLAPVVVPYLGGVYDKLFPVNKDWTVTRQWVEGADLLVEGTMVKARCTCKYVPPPRARDRDGFNFRVDSTSPTAATSWACDAKPQRFGPWRVVGAAGAEVTFYQEHQCTSLWTSFTELGTVKP